MKNIIRANRNGGKKPRSSQAQSPSIKAPAAAATKYVLMLQSWNETDFPKTITFDEIDVTHEDFKKIENVIAKMAPISPLKVGLEAMLNAFPPQSSAEAGREKMAGELAVYKDRVRDKADRMRQAVVQSEMVFCMLDEMLESAMNLLLKSSKNDKAISSADLVGKMSDDLHFGLSLLSCNVQKLLNKSAADMIEVAYNPPG